MTKAETREKLRKKIKFRKDVNDMWCAMIVMADGYHYSYSFPGPAKTAKPEARERLIDQVLESDHPLPLGK